MVRLSDGSRMNFNAEGMRARFAADGNSITYIRAQRDLVSPPFPSPAGPAVKVIFPFSSDSAITNFTYSPDGSRLVVSYAESSGSLVMADGVPNVAAPVRGR